MNFKQKINRFFSINLLPFGFNRQQQIEWLSEYPKPKDLIERSYFQFRIQFNLFPIHRRLINNILGFFLCLVAFLVGIILSIKNLNNKIILDNKKAVFPYKNYHYPNILPEELKQEFEILEANYLSGIAFTFKDLKLILRIWSRNPLQFYFLAKCISKIQFYRYLSINYQPKAIISSSEYAFTSSVSTLFCRENGIEHINIMHGEKFFFIRDSFFEFDRFYVWDEFYVKLFISMRAESSQFIVGDFSHLKMNLKNEPIFNYTYYLAAESPETLNCIKNNLLSIDQPSNICIRYHPRYSKMDEIKEIFEGFIIENPLEVSLEESFERTQNIVSLYSSCLVQASLNGKSVVIDDCSHGSDKFKILEESDFIIFHKPHTLLSEVATRMKRDLVTPTF